MQNSRWGQNGISLRTRTRTHTLSRNTFISFPFSANPYTRFLRNDSTAFCRTTIHNWIPIFFSYCVTPDVIYYPAYYQEVSFCHSTGLSGLKWFLIENNNLQDSLCCVGWLYLSPLVHWKLLHAGSVSSLVYSCVTAWCVVFDNAWYDNWHCVKSEPL